MNYIAPFETVRNILTISKTSGNETIAEFYEPFLDALRLLLAGVDVDEGWYLAQNPDIAEAIRAGMTESAKRHFVEYGYFEGRLPFYIAVDERWYLLQNPDVAENVRRGVVESAQRHFFERLPGRAAPIPIGRFPFASQCATADPTGVCGLTRLPGRDTPRGECVQRQPHPKWPQPSCTAVGPLYA